MAKAKTGSNFLGEPWSDAEKRWLLKMYGRKKPATHEEVVEALNRRYHKGKKVRTEGSVKQRRVLLRNAANGKTPSTALAKTNGKSNGITKRGRKAARISAEVVESPTKRLFAFQTPDLTVQVQIEGDKGSDEMLKRMAASVLES